MSSFTERAYGRVNLIGEHTDYNGGWVLPTAIPQFTEVTIEPRSDRFVQITSSKDRAFTYHLGQEMKTNSWVDYLQGGTKLLQELLSSREIELRGFTAHIHSTMPEGSGLSSSAALEISLLKALRKCFTLPVSDIELALLGQRIENEFVGARVGIMDQMAVTLARTGEALFLDTKELTYERISLPLKQMDLVVINSGLAHQLSSHDGGYNQRRSQCEEACQLLGISQLRDIDAETLETKNLPDVLKKRARHVVTENARVFQAVEALKEIDLIRLGQLFLESHRSMRDDYQVSIPAIDLLVELCQRHPECFGARLTGGGFGGSIVAITQKDQGRRIAEEVVKAYDQKTGHRGTILVS